jgi:hypothetical protein
MKGFVFAVVLRFVVGGENGNFFGRGDYENVTVSLS